MVNIKEEKYEHKLVINQNTKLVKVIGKLTAKLEINGKEVVFETAIEKNAGFVENIKADIIRETMKEINHELFEKEERFIKGLREIESLQLEIEIY